MPSIHSGCIYEIDNTIAIVACYSNQHYLIDLKTGNFLNNNLNNTAGDIDFPVRNGSIDVSGYTNVRLVSNSLKSYLDKKKPTKKEKDTVVTTSLIVPILRQHMDNNGLDSNRYEIVAMVNFRTEVRGEGVSSMINLINLLGITPSRNITRISDNSPMYSVRFRNTDLWEALQ